MPPLGLSDVFNGSVRPGVGVGRLRKPSGPDRSCAPVGFGGFGEGKFADLITCRFFYTPGFWGLFICEGSGALYVYSSGINKTHKRLSIPFEKHCTHIYFCTQVYVHAVVILLFSQFWIQGWDCLMPHSSPCPALPSTRVTTFGSLIQPRGRRGARSLEC